VLRNLISNAAEAIDPSSGVGAIRLSAERHDPQHVRIVVADNGPGIPAASRERVFEPFFSGKASGMELGACCQPCDCRGAWRELGSDARAARRVLPGAASRGGA